MSRPESASARPARSYGMTTVFTMVNSGPAELSVGLRAVIVPT
jgi:hypothetical protein